MVFRFTCLCSNISLDLAQAPTEHNFGDKPKYKWVQLIKWKKVLKGKMSLGGVRTVSCHSVSFGLTFMTSLVFSSLNIVQNYFILIVGLNLFRRNT